MDLIRSEQHDEYDIEMVVTFLEFQYCFRQSVVPSEDVTTWYSDTWHDFGYEWFQHILGQMEEGYAKDHYGDSFKDLSEEEQDEVIWMVHNGGGGTDDFWTKVKNAVVNSSCFLRTKGSGWENHVIHYNAPLQEVW